MLDICWFSTGRDLEAYKLLLDVIEATKKKKIDGRIVLCFLNQEEGESLYSDKMIMLLKNEGIPIQALSTKKFLLQKRLSLNEGRRFFDEEVLRRIENYKFDLIFLAGYMLILSEILFEKYTILNLHPSLPGKYKGKWEEVVRKIIENEEKVFGAMIHIVSERLDEGPPVTYCKITLPEEFSSLYENVKRKDSSSYEKLFTIIRQREFAIETPLIIETLSALSKGEIKIRDKNVYWQNEKVLGGIDLTERIIGGGIG